MYKLSLVLGSVLFAAPALAQESSALAASAPSVAMQQTDRDDSDTFFGRRKLVHHHGFYVGPALGMTIIDGYAAGVIGVRSAWTLNHRFGLGFAASGFSNDMRDERSSRNRLEGGYGGVLLQYIIASNRRVHGFTETTIGGGALCVYGNDDDDCGEYGFFMIENTANLELNLTSFARAALGAGYRFAVGEDDSPLSNRELSGFVAKTSVTFGRF